MNFYCRVPKRLLDLAIAVPAAVVAAPVIALVGLLIRWQMGSPVLFRQQRAGYLGEPFYIYKFRTMLNTRDAQGVLLPDEQRLTRLGSWLRRLSLDELPQLWNVLWGEMSLVGPRPLLMQYLPRYSPEQARRHLVRPGITGWAQVNGRNALTWPEKFRLDVWYVDHVSYWVDLKVLALTAWRVVRRDGISSNEHVTMPEFMGN
ncbi:MAG: sugar transferase [Pirellulales bacterium]